MSAQWFRKESYRRMRRAARLHCEPLEDRTAPAATRSVSPTEVIVRVTGPDPVAVIASHRELAGINTAASTSLGGDMVSVPLAGATPEDALAALRRLPEVALASPNYRYTGVTLDAFPAGTAGAADNPTDSLFGNQSNLKAVGVYDNISPANAWTYLNSKGITLGLTATAVAVLDDGIRNLYSPDQHPDLNGGIGTFVTTNGAPYNNLDISGWDFVEGDKDTSWPLPVSPSTSTPTHGEQVASVIAARTNNGQGLAGVAGGNNNTGGVKILPLRIFSTNSNGSVSTETTALAAALNYTVGRAKILNLSFELDTFVGDPMVGAAFDTVAASGGIVFASAGNDGILNPARQAFGQVIFVGSTNNSGVKSSFSNSGNYVDLSAPGESIQTATNPGASNPAGYSLASGTSFSATAAGVAALLQASANNAMPRDQLLSRLFATATPLGSLNSTFKGQMGAGLVNAYAAITTSTATYAPPTFGDVTVSDAAATKLVAGTTTVSVTNFSSITLKTPRSVFFGATEKALPTFDSTSMVPANFDLRGDGPDNLFNTADDTVIPLTFATPYRPAGEAVTLNITGPLVSDHYRFTAISGGSALRDPFSNVLDGDNDGLAGGNLVREFDAVVPALSVEHRINTITAATQDFARVAVAANGQSVVVWNDTSTAADVVGRIFDRNGTPLSAEFRINQTPNGNATEPDVACDSAGNFVVVWNTQSSGTTRDVYLRRFNAAGVALDNQVKINSTTAEFITQPQIGMNASGAFAISYTKNVGAESGNIYYRVYSNTGAALFATEKLAHTGVNGIQGNGYVAMQADGKFVIAWPGSENTTTPELGDTSGYGAYIRGFNADGTPIGPERRISNVTAGDQSTADVIAMDGYYIAEFLTADSVGANTYDQQFRFIDASGVPTGGDLPMNNYKTGNQLEAVLVRTGGGRFMGIWTDVTGKDGSGYGVYARQFDADGRPYSDDFRINAVTTGDQRILGAGSNSAGDYVIPFQSNVTGDNDILLRQSVANTRLVSLTANTDTNAITETERVIQTVNTFTASFSLPLTASTVTNAANWQLTVDGKAAAITAISAPMLNAATGMYDVTLTPATAILQGAVTVTAKQSILDANGNKLDGDADGLFGGDYVRSFTVVSIGPSGNNSGVNTTNTGSQGFGSPAMTPDGRSVIVWTGNGLGDTTGVYARMYDANGTPQGNEVRVNEVTTGNQSVPKVATDWSGNFVVVWESTASGTSRVMGRRFNAAGIGGAEFPLDPVSAGAQYDPSVAMSKSGRFVVSWNAPDAQYNGVFVRTFDALANPIGASIQANQFTTGEQYASVVDSDMNDNFVVSWMDFNNHEGNGSKGVYARMFRSDGTASGNEFQVNSTIAGDQSYPKLSVGDMGEFVIAWESNGQGDDEGEGIYAQNYNSAGVPTTGEYRVNITTVGHQANASVAIDADGDYTVAWRMPDHVGSADSNPILRRYNRAGVPVSGELMLASPSIGNQDIVRIASDATGNTIAVWTSYTPTDGNGEIITQRIGVNNSPTTTGLAPVTTPEDTAATVSFAGKFADVAEPFLNLTYTLTNNSAALFSASLDAANQKFTVTPVANAVGTGTVTVRATDAGGLFVDLPVTITVMPVNDAPTFAAGANFGNIVRNKNQNLIDIASFVTNPLPGGGADEAGQGVSFEISANSNPALFTTPPAISFESGTYHLKFDPVDDAYGAAVVQVRARDTGGTANGGVDASAPLTFTITVSPTDIQQPPVLQFNGTARPVNNITQTGSQLNADVAADASGNYVVVWQGPGTGTDIYARLYEANGAPKTDEFRVNTLITAGEQLNPKAAMTADGRFGVTWTTERPSFTTDTYFRLYDAAGLPLSTGETIAHATDATNDVQSSPDIALAPDGSAVVLWSGRSVALNMDTSDVFGRRFTPTGAGTGSEFVVNDNSAVIQSQPVIAMDALGNFAVAWYDLNGAVANIQARTFFADGTPRKSQFPVNTIDADTQDNPAIAMDATGRFVVAWETNNNDGSGEGVAYQRFAADGTKFGTEQYPYPTSGGSAGNSGNQIKPSVAMDADGDFAIGWSGANPLDAAGAFFQMVKADGTLVGTTQTANSYATGTQQTLRLAMDHDGDLVTVWDGQGLALNGTTVLAQEVFHRRFGYRAAVGVETNSVTNPPTGTEGLNSFNIPLTSYFTFVSGGGGTEAINNYVVTKITNRKILNGTPTVGGDPKTLNGKLAGGAENGSAEVQVRIADGSEGSITSVSNYNNNTIVIRRLQSLNSPVLGFIRDRAISEGQTLSLAFNATDPTGGGKLAYSLVSSTGASSVNFDSIGGLAWTPADQQAAATFTVRVTNTATSGAGAGEYTQETFDVAVANAAPTGVLTGPAAVGVGATPTFRVTGGSDAPADLATGLRYSFDFDGDAAWNGAGSCAAASTSSSAVGGAANFGVLGPRLVRARVYDKDNGYGEFTFTTVVSATAPPATATVTVNAGAVQRSQVTSLTVQFSEAVAFPNGLAAAFTLARTGPGAPAGAVTLAFSPVVNNSLTITFNDAVLAGTPAKSLVDGVYALTLNAAGMSGFDGNGDGLAGDNAVSPVKRLFGDADGNGTINIADLTAFGNAFNTSDPTYDYNGDGVVNTADLTAFGNNFGFTI